MIDEPQKGESPAPSPDEAEGKEPKDLTPEEQLAAYEEQLKEDDWGHQPC